MHFSIGFVVEGHPRKPVVSVCAGVIADHELYASVTNSVAVDAYWPRDDGMTCGIGSGCIQSGDICVPRGDDVSVIFSVYDEDGDEFDLKGAQEIVFAVGDAVGGPVRFVKRMSLGEITIGGSMYQFMVAVTGADTDTLYLKNSYYEVRVTTSTGLNKTVSAGVFKSERTLIKEVV